MPAKAGIQYAPASHARCPTTDAACTGFRFSLRCARSAGMTGEYFLQNAAEAAGQRQTTAGPTRVRTHALHCHARGSGHPVRTGVASGTGPTTRPGDYWFRLSLRCSLGRNDGECGRDRPPVTIRPLPPIGSENRLGSERWNDHCFRLRWQAAASAPVASQRLPRQRLPNDSNMKMINSMSQIVIIADTIAPPLCSSQDVRSPAPGPHRRGAVLRLEIASGGGNL